MDIPVLSITGSDSTGGTGIQADIRTISAMGARALTAVTSVTFRNSNGIQSFADLPCDVIVGQVRAVIAGSHPRAVKVGMVRDSETVCRLRDEIVGCQRIVLSPGILSSGGETLIPDSAAAAVRDVLLPEATLLMLRCNEAERLLGTTIVTDDDMLAAARRLTDMGAGAVLLRGGHTAEERLTALLYAAGEHRFFSSRNTEGWQKHGVTAAMSSAVATRLAFGDDVPTAVSRAHEYMHSQVVYSVTTQSQRQRPADIYNSLLSLIADRYSEAHDVQYYADRLAVSTRYLSRVTGSVVGRSPKQIIADYLMRQAEILLATSRLSVGEVAARLGFSSPATFTKFFVEHEGCPPQDFRARL